jgi:hypothetical protein
MGRWDNSDEGVAKKHVVMRPGERVPFPRSTVPLARPFVTVPSEGAAGVPLGQVIGRCLPFFVHGDLPRTNADQRLIGARIRYFFGARIGQRRGSRVAHAPACTAIQTGSIPVPFSVNASQRPDWTAAGSRLKHPFGFQVELQLMLPPTTSTLSFLRCPKILPEPSRKPTRGGKPDYVRAARDRRIR